MAYRNIVCGEDQGNLRNKFAWSVDGGPVQTHTIQSQFRVTSFKTSSLIRCVKSESDWANQGFFLDATGDRATYKSDTGKQDNCLPLFVAGLWDFIESGDTWNVVACVPRVKQNGDALKKTLNGYHEFESKGVNKWFTVNVIDVVNEGAGAIYQCSDDTPYRLLTELGGRTCNNTLFEYVTAIHDPAIVDKIGSVNLLGYIGRSDLAIDIKGLNGLTLKEAIDVFENPKHLLKVGGKTHDFTATITEKVKLWLDDVTSEVESLTFGWGNKADAHYVAGGVCMNKIVASQLKDYGWKILSNPDFANALGNLELAKQKLVMA